MEPHLAAQVPTHMEFSPAHVFPQGFGDFPFLVVQSSSKTDFTET